ncbi:MAG TPA: aminotransferase class V-fold PLP-dependent enzyme, partial [Blastocatellia bacterium]
MDELLEWRKEFPILDNTVYLISHSLGAMPRRTRERLQEYADMWATRGIRSWEEGWWMMATTVGDLVGKIIGAPEGEVVMHPNVSVCQSVVLSSLDFTGRRNKIVSESFNFPSNLYIYHALKSGARLVSVPSDDGITVPLERMLEAIDEQTRLVSVSHVIFRSSFIQDLKAITDRAH